MKKLSLLVALILCVTIGGVYANWTYVNNEDIEDKTAQIGVTISGITSVDDVIGEFTITTNFNILIEPLSVKNPNTTNSEHDDYVLDANHKAALLFVDDEGDVVTTPTITLTFEPTEHAPMDVQENGPTSWFYLIDSTKEIENGTPMLYEGNEIFEYTYTKTNPLSVDWGTAESGVFTVTISATEIISLGKPTSGDYFIIDTSVKHNHFATQVNGNNIIAHITDDDPNGNV